MKEVSTCKDMCPLMSGEFLVVPCVRSSETVQHSFGCHSLSPRDLMMDGVCFCKNCFIRIAKATLAFASHSRSHVGALQYIAYPFAINQQWCIFKEVTVVIGILRLSSPCGSGK